MTGCADASAKEELQLEIRRLRERIKGLESENTTMHIKMSKTQQDVDQRLTDIEMQIGPEEPPLLVGLEPINADNNDCVWKTYFAQFPGWHDVACSRTYQEEYGQLHALCEAAK